MENQRIHLTRLMNHLKENLDRKLRDFYGNIVSNTSSAHILLHSTIADVLESKYSNEESINDRMIMDCLVQLARIAGRKGNIYADHIFSYVVLTIEDYLRLRKTTKNRIRIDNKNLSRSYQYKIITELVASGMEYDEETNEVFFEPPKLKIPKMISLASNIEKGLNVICSK